MSNTTPFRVGFGYDIHRTIKGRDLILGGVKIPSEFGLDGHSDADCLSHAIADALLGTCGLPDIGHLFPNTDESIKGISSLKILENVNEEIQKHGASIVNIDAMIIAEQPKVSPYLDAMKAELSKTLNIPINCIGIKATTNETVDDIGKGLAIAAHAVCLVTLG